jgi:Leucine-rich repeat (LRR) protein
LKLENNLISKIKGLNELKNLKELRLNNNKISVIEKLDNNT